MVYVADNKLTHDFYQRWYENWQEYLIDNKRRADQPPLIKTDKEFGYIIKRLPDVFNCQMTMSMKYYNEAYILHFFHIDFIKDQSYSPFVGQDIYRDIKAAVAITPNVEELIRHCKSAFQTPSMVIGKAQMDVLYSPFAQAFLPLHQNIHIPF